MGVRMNGTGTVLLDSITNNSSINLFLEVSLISSSSGVLAAVTISIASSLGLVSHASHTDLSNMSLGEILHPSYLLSW